ncbi:hypothetical protein [Nostoc sp.]|uniref:hypothetical protein n=1 Tax=Nostoc sp. TaxID=1180 RepID=UPI002FF54F9B
MPSVNLLSSLLQQTCINCRLSYGKFGDAVANCGKCREMEFLHHDRCLRQHNGFKATNGELGLELILPLEF